MAEMDMKEKLVELLGADVCKHDSCDNCECQGSADMCIATLKSYMADHLIQNGVTFATDNNAGSKWIPVTERLPEGDKVVMCYKAGRGIRFGTLLDATYADGVQAFMDRDRTFAFGVTHWMPLPEPPKEVE